MERGAEKLIKEKRKKHDSRGGSPADPAAGDPVPEVRTRGQESRVNTAAAGRPAEPAGNAGQRIKTKDTYLRAQPLTPASGLTPERTQGQHPFIRERGRQAAQKSAQAKPSRCGTRQAVGRSLLSLWEIPGPPAELRLGMGAGRTGPYRPCGQRRSLPRIPARCQKGNAERLP